MLVTHGQARRNRGFTVTELVVTVGIVAILAGIAGPGFSTFMDTMDAKTASMQFVADLSMARSEALRRNSSVTMAPVSSSWTNGWTVTGKDSSGNSVTLVSRGALRKSLSINAPTTGLTFLSSGRLQTSSDSDTTSRSWTLSSTSSSTQRCIFVSPVGTARSKTGACS
jgi:type IV fimbrial biogenesis protein FimT